MEFATLAIALAAIVLFWNTLKELLTGVTGNTRRVIRVTDKTTRKWLADAAIEEMQTATSYCDARGWEIKESAKYEAFIKAMEIIEAEPAQQKKLAEELAAFLRANQAQAPKPAESDSTQTPT